MKSIKFKIYDIENQEIIEPCDVPFEVDYIMGEFLSMLEDGGDDKYKPILSTGFFDNQGKEIYHFDLLQLRGCKEVYWVDWHFNRWILRDKRGRIQEFNKLDFEGGFFQRIGIKIEELRKK